ncbi:MAG: biosynthetic-type acetolactate synthase large subunit [Spirochaetales bacterium]|nr:biosynthetic-type acetolactate synthase large subunit [Spirochaetales bacterium]
MKLSGAEIVIECLKEQKVETMFGFPGGAVIKIYDALFKDGTINHVLTAHEQGAAHAADGYARASGKVGVCMATSGPGATNLVTGIATAYMDSIPMVAITGNTPEKLLGKDSFQEVDIVGITMPVTKHNFMVTDITKLAATIREAFIIAASGRPGPVLVDIPKNITIETTEYEYKKPEPIMIPKPKATEADWDRAVEMIKEANRPYIYAGGGITLGKAAEELKTLVRKIDAVLGLSLMAMDCLEMSDPHYTGMIGMHGSKASNLAMKNCDLLIVLGARFSDRVVGKTEGFHENKRILHIDIDPAEINKNVPTDHSIISHMKPALQELNKRVPEKKHPRWMSEILELKELYPVSRAPQSQRPKQLLDALTDLTKGEAIIATEVGQHQMWAAQFYGFKKPYSFLTSGGLGTMGYGTGAAIGACFACPDRPVINVAGDGSFRMNCQEISTAAQHKLPLVILLMNNKTLGMVRQWQTLFYEGRYSSTDLSYAIDWVKFAESFGAKGMRIAAGDDPKPVLEAALNAGGPVIVDCEIPLDNKVFPMVPPGAALDELVLGEEVDD